MSYILDALRKAEKDRNLGRTPSLGDVTSPSARAPASSGPSRRVLALIALVLGMLVLAILLWPPAPEVAAPPAIAVAPVPAPAPPVSPPSTLPSGDSELAMRNLPEDNPADPTVGADVAAESIDDLMDDTDVDAAAEAEAEAAPLDEGAPAAAPKPAPRTAAESPLPQAPAPESGPAEVDGIPLLRSMPSDYRGAFPELRVDVHVYDDDPARRWTLINGKKAVEGSTIPEGPTVSEIRPDGIVFDFRGHTSLFPLGHQ